VRFTDSDFKSLGDNLLLTLLNYSIIERKLEKQSKNSGNWL
jgi:hypothetical protein